ncbi:MAG: hypothetical protein EBU88_06825 [Acidobacteria bacterium]|nr:hypothetical protein [Acidobacteriota bacterium]
MPSQTSFHHLQFAASRNLRDYLLKLAGLLHYLAECRLFIDWKGQTQYGRSLTRLNEKDNIFFIDYRLKHTRRGERLYLKIDEQNIRVQATLLTNCQADDHLWLQPSIPNPLQRRLFALLINREGQSIDNFHPQVFEVALPGRWLGPTAKLLGATLGWLDCYKIQLKLAADQGIFK